MPEEIQLCEVLGITEEDYWFFVDKTESYNGQRLKAYDLIPDIKNDFTGGFLTQLVIGIVLSVVSYLMTPKPKEQQYKTPPSLTTAGATGTKRFAPQTGFDSVQELAELGATIPLVFTDKTGNYGGVRVNAKLVWSQLLSLGKGQQLKGVFLISSGTLGVKPEFAGYAIGDMLLENYTQGKLALYFHDGAAVEDVDSSIRLLETRDRYHDGTLERESFSNDIALPLLYSDEDGFYSDTIFCGTRSPRTQTEFGLYDPLPNSMKFMLPYELVLKGKDATNQGDIDKKRNKIATRYPRYASVYKVNHDTTHGRKTVNEGDLITYRIGEHSIADEYSDEFGPWGIEDVQSSVNAGRESADDSITVGEQFMIGTSVAICYKIPDNKLWDEGIFKEFIFKATEAGEVDVRAVNPVDPAPADHNSFELLIPQKCAIATVSNTKACNTTEIGLKSTVWRQITGFPNVNSHPGYWQYGSGSGTVHDYEQSNGNISLGSMNKYVKRLSFFHLFIRELGSNSQWTKLGNKPFCVMGRTPQPKYNFLRINHPFNQYEFKFTPYPGNKVREEFGNTTINRLGGNQLVDFKHGDFNVYFAGSINFELTPNQLSNEEWYLSDLPDDAEGVVLDLDSFTSGTIPTNMGWDAVEGPLETYGHDWKKGSHGFCSRSSRVNRRPHQWIFRWKDGVAGYKNTTQGGDPPDDFCVESGGAKYCLTPASSGHNDRASITKYLWQPVEVNPTNYDDIPVINGPLKEGEAYTDPGNSSHQNNSMRVNVQVFTKGDQTGYKWTLVNGGSGYKTGQTVTIPHANVTVTIYTDSANLITDPWPQGQNLNPYDAISDYITYDAERSSHLDGPEHLITYVNEQIRSSNQPYTRLALAGVRMNSSKEWSSFSQLSVYVQKGIQVESLIHGDQRSTNLFPDIAYALLTDPLIGAGDLIGTVSVDKESMRTAARFCEANNFYWDGVITENQNLREFIYQQASYCFLDFTIIGGRFSLVPAVPYDSNYVIENSQKPKIKALFTDGNTKDLKVSFLSPEERQLFQAKVLWRKEKENGFPETKVAEVRLSDEEGGSERDPRESFDMSLFCTSEDHATTFAMFALKVRKEVDHGIKFTTTPQAAMHLRPGEYFRFYSESTHTSRFSNGVITENGTVQSQSIITNGTNIYYWKPGDAEVTGPEPIELISGYGYTNIAGMAFRGCVFTVAQTDISDRVYKVESITYGEEGFVEIAGSHEPLTSTGSLATLDWGNDDFT